MSSPRDAASHGPHHVYRCYTASGMLLYIGVAQDVEARMFHHLHACNMGKQSNGTLRRLMTRCESVLYPTRLDARAEERRAIRDEAPLLNKQHNPRRFRKAGTAGYALVEPVHPITAAAFPELSAVERVA